MTNHLEKIIKCTNIDFPRIDGKGACTGITLGKQYTVIGGINNTCTVLLTI